MLEIVTSATQESYILQPKPCKFGSLCSFEQDLVKDPCSDDLEDENEKVKCHEEQVQAKNQTVSCFLF